MGRAEKPADRLPSQRQPREERQEQADDTALQQRIDEVERQLKRERSFRTAAEKRARIAEEKLAEKDGKRKSKGKMSKGTFDRQAAASAGRWVEKYAPEDIPTLALAIVKKASRTLKKDLASTAGLSKASCFRKVKKQIFAERDSQIYKHLKENVFPGKRSALLRLMVGFSKREAHMVSQSFKYTRKKDGTRTRTMLAPDSAMPLPVPFELADIKIAESEALAAVNLPASEYSAQRANATFNVTRKEKLPGSKYKKTVKKVGAKETKYSTTA